MKRELVHDPIFLAQTSEPATKDDLQTAKDLMDTLLSYRGSCVGMAANMIGVRKRIICFDAGICCMTMLNPEIISSSEPYETEEGCLSLLGGPRKTTRYHRVTVRYQTLDFKLCTQEFQGFTAQIIQHEVDHCNGILI